MSFVDAVKSAFANYVCFSGRARRSEYWYFVLFQVIVSVVLSILTSVTGATIFTVLATLFSLAVLLPSLGLSIRRLHDIGKSGWWLFIGLVPVVGSILLLVWTCKDSEPGDNAYGANPKA